MPPIVIDVQKAEDSRDVVHRAVQALVEGRLVVFPTETVYGVAASALSEAGVRRLLDVKTRVPGHPVTLAVKSAEDAWDYVPGVSSMARRLARRCWPGPITLVMPDRHPDSLLRRLPQIVQDAVCPADTIGLRVPAHDLLLDVLDMLAGPILLTSANQPGEPAASDAKRAVVTLGDDVDLVLDDGPCRFGEASSVVKVTEAGLEVLRPGVITEQTLHRLATFLVVVVCTGNTCRSPMGEALFRKHIATKLKCGLEELEDRGVLVMSAGIAAMAGSPASPESVEIMKQRQLSLIDHVSQPVTDRLVRHADVIFAMTRGHRAGLLAQWPELANRAELLCLSGEDVSDPIGGPMEMYVRAADQIERAIESRVQEMNFSELCPKKAP